jgi:hypothetical protein
MNNEYHKSHNSFFQIITKNRLNELLHRASNTNELETTINNEIAKNNLLGRCQVNIKKCDVYIEFYNEHNIQIGHISFHFSQKDNTLRNQRQGRFHAKNNRNKSVYTFKINKTNPSSILMYSKNKFIRKDFKPYLDIGMAIINDYFNKTSPLFLGNYTRNYNTNKHDCFDTIINKFPSEGSKSLRDTRKR